MHLRVSVKRQGHNTYRYVQLVESYRRPQDGMPAHRVVASLGDLPEQDIANLKLALQASRGGQRLVLPSQQAARLPGRAVRANLRYLELAVCWELWRGWGLGPLLAELLGPSEADTALCDVIGSLTLQRCVAPGSTLEAQRWLPTTALPELLGLAPAKVNNTRLHRALDALDRVTPELQERLPKRYQAREGAFTSLFLDVTDTWFVGHGPELAQYGKTKEGMVRRKIGIVLLCNEHGYPLRWQLLPGKRQDGEAMSDVVCALEQVHWVGEAPLVCDRAMGRAAYVRRLAESGLRFLTALPVDEYDSYTDRIPHQAFAEIGLRSETADEPRPPSLIERLADAARAAGLQPVSETVYVLDLGLIGKQARRGSALVGNGASSAGSPAAWLREAVSMKRELERGEATSLADLGRRHGCAKAVANTRLQLLNLAADIQQAILAGQAEVLSLATMRRIRCLPTPQEQRAAFTVALEHAAQRPAKAGSSTAVRGSAAARTADEPPELRAVVYFNPEMFLRQRQRADDKLAGIYGFVRELNERLASPNSRRNETSIHAEIGRQLHRHNLADAFEVELGRRERSGRSFFQASVQLKPDAWQRRRRYDGFSVLVGHPELPQSAAELVALYRAKDAVEKDFQSIKSVAKLRPVWHRTDPKVRAHVTLCMLALLLERTLEQRLKQAGIPCTAANALEQLGTCHLNQLAVGELDAPVYSVTQPTAAQQQILQALAMADLADDQRVAETIAPR